MCFYHGSCTWTYVRIGAILTIHLDIIIQTINDALFGGLLSVSTLDHVAVSPLLKSYRSHWKMCRQILEKKNRWKNRHNSAASNSWLCLPLLPAAGGTMVQHQTDSSVDNVTPPVQSWVHKEAGAERRAQSAAAWTRRGHVRPLLPNKVGFTATSGHIYGDLGWKKKIWARGGRLKQDNSEHFYMI